MTFWFWLQLKDENVGTTCFDMVQYRGRVRSDIMCCDGERKMAALWQYDMLAVHGASLFTM